MKRRKMMSDYYVLIYKYNHKTKKKELGTIIPHEWLPTLGLSIESKITELTFGEEAYKMFEKKVEMLEKATCGDLVNEPGRIFPRRKNEGTVQE
jgi:hypothetical protein